MSKKSKTSQTQNQQTTMTTTPTNPQWVTDGLAGMGSMISGLAQQDPRSFIAGPDPLQMQAAKSAANLGNFGGRSSSGGGYDPTANEHKPLTAPPPGMTAPQADVQGFWQTMGMAGPAPGGLGGGPMGQMPTGGAQGGSIIQDRAAFDRDASFMGGTPGQRGPSGVTDPYGSAMSTFDRMQSSGANTYNPAQGTASQFAGATLGAAPQFAGAQVGPAAQYGGTQAGPASQFGGTRAAAASQFGGTDAGQAAQYGGTNVGDAAQYGGTRLGAASLMGEAPQVQSQSLLDNLNRYMSPYTNDVVNSTLASFDDNSGRVRAAQSLDLANDSTFGGSGGSILRSLTEGQLGLSRAQTEAQLRDSAFNTGANLSGQDATRRQSASSENANNALQRLMANQNAQNSFTLAQGGFDQQTGLANTDAQNAMRQLQASLNQQTGLANTGAINDRSALQAGLNQQTGLANTDALNSRSALQAGLDQQTGLANTDALNTRSALQAGLNQQTGLANTDAQNQAQLTQAQLLQQAGINNQNVSADFLKTQGGFDQQAGLANMDARNQFGLHNMDAQNAAGQFNATQQDAALQRQMAGAQGLVSTAGAQQDNERQNISTQSQIGAILQALAQQKAGAPLAQAGVLSQLWNQLPLNLLNGQTANGTMSGTSTGTSKESGAALGDWLNFFAANAQAAAKAGAGG